MIIAIPRFLGPVLLDVVLEEEHFSDLAITENPIEFGADVADHAYIEPKRLRMRCAIGTTRSIGVLHAGMASQRVAQSYEAILRLQAEKEPFSIVSGLRLYENMLIEHVNVFRDHMNAAILDFDVGVREVIIVESAYAEGSGDTRQGKSNPNAPNKKQSGDAHKRGAGNVNTGQQTPAPQSMDSSTVEGSRNTVLFDMIGLQ